MTKGWRVWGSNPPVTPQSALLNPGPCKRFSFQTASPISEHICSAGAPCWCRARACDLGSEARKQEPKQGGDGQGPAAAPRICLAEEGGPHAVGTQAAVQLLPVLFFRSPVASRGTDSSAWFTDETNGLKRTGLQAQGL